MGPCIRGTFDENQLEYTYDAENRLIWVRNVDALAAACDVDLVFSTSGDAAQSGAMEFYGVPRFPRRFPFLSPLGSL